MTNKLQAIQDIKDRRDAALVHAREIAATANAADLRAASERVEEAQRELSAALSEGANPCPRCGAAPVGIEQPSKRGGVEYEIGCRACTPFEHTDGTLRLPRVVGGMIPRHAVEAWNEGPSQWLLVPPHKVDDVRLALLKADAAATLVRMHAANVAARES